MSRALNEMADKAQAVCTKFGWKQDWSHGGCYLHLEVSEFIEALRGKGSANPTGEAADVLFVLLSMCRTNNIGLDEVQRYFHKRCDDLLALHEGGSTAEGPDVIPFILDMAEEGQRHNIPWCCGLRFGLDWVCPKVLPRLLGLCGVRLQKVLLTPRRAFALEDGQGYVPCEYHLLRWLLTGTRPDIKQDPVEEQP